VEHTYLTKEEDEPNPVLGKEQFEAVAEGLRAFDRYLVLAHGFTESETAKREGVRDDSFMALRPSAATPTPSTKRTAQGGVSPRPELRINQVIGSDDDSESDSDDESDDESDDSDDPKTAKNTKAKSGNADSSGAPESSEISASQANQMEQFQQFLKWQKMQ
jgi:hypothetical protein